MNPGKAISTIDGRYRAKVAHLSSYFSEYALVKKRCEVEIKYLLELNKTNLFGKLPEGKVLLARKVNENFDEKDYSRIKEIEKEINHDVKACEYFLKEKLSLDRVENMIHFGLTSEDINNLAYTSLFKEFLENEHLPILRTLLLKLIQLAEKWKKIAMPARTHGQKASPTTAGKEIAVFISRLLRYYEKLDNFRFQAKLNGATGNFSAMEVAFPSFDWCTFSIKFIENMDFDVNLATTQIEDHDAWADYFNIAAQINNIILDMNRDIWLYISHELFLQRSRSADVGSSTMPHKINPINFENSEGNIMLANCLLRFMADMLCTSRMQRDLSDSTVERNIGVAFSHTYLALDQTLQGLQKIKINQEKCKQEIKNSPELLAEPVQSILRSGGVNKPYEMVKLMTRGKKIGNDFIEELISRLNLKKRYVKKLRSLSVDEYTGKATKICEEIIAIAKEKIR